MKQFLLSPFVLALVVVLGGVGIIYFLFGPGPQGSENMPTNSNMPIQSHRSYEVETVSSLNDTKPNQQTEVVYKIKDDQGTILKHFDVVHEKIMHFIVIRKDLQYFQHIHPGFDKTTGQFFIPVTFAIDGEYRMFADFTPSSGQMGPGGEKLPVTIYQDISVGDLAKYSLRPLGNIQRNKTFDGYDIAMTSSSEPLTSQNDYSITFDIMKNGKPVTNLQKYLGALGHTVVLREGDLQFIHAHPMQHPDAKQTGKVNFMITFPEAGYYKLFSQFQHEGQIITSDFLVNVVEGVKSSPGDTMIHKNNEPSNTTPPTVTPEAMEHTIH